MPEHPLPPDFPDLPQKLQGIVGFAEYHKWREAMKKWLRELAISESRFVEKNFTFLFEKQIQSKQSFQIRTVDIIEPPIGHSSSAFSSGGSDESFENFVICRSSDGIFVVSPAFDFDSVPMSSGGERFGDGMAGDRLSRYFRVVKRVAVSYLVQHDSPDGQGAFIEETDTKNVTEIFSPAYSPVFIHAGGPPTAPVKGDFATFTTDISRTVPFVTKLIIAASSVSAMTANPNLVYRADPNAPVFTGWVDMNSQSARWLPVKLFDGQWWNNATSIDRYTYSIFDQ